MIMVKFNPLKCKKDPETCGHSMRIHEMIICEKTEKGERCHADSYYSGKGC